MAAKKEWRSDWKEGYCFGDGRELARQSPCCSLHGLWVIVSAACISRELAQPSRGLRPLAPGRHGTNPITSSAPVLRVRGCAVTEACVCVCCSGLAGPERAVMPVYLRCSQGRLQWAYPRGALRVVLRLGASSRDFRACVKASGASRSARLLVETPGRLAPLHFSSSSAASCFHSRAGRAALYVEAAGGGRAPLTREVLAITYHLEALPRGKASYDPAEGTSSPPHSTRRLLFVTKTFTQCRPCSTEEMGHSYCTSDLDSVFIKVILFSVARGIIQAVENDHSLEVSRMTVKLTKLLRHSTEDNNPEGGLVDSVPVKRNSVLEHDSAGDKRIRIDVPLHCGAKHGTGEFVFMARRKLGDLTLTCAPRLEDWAEVVSRTNRDGSAHCVLKS
ncbi:hypothetical protein PR048_005066 [Dryococelus australis]|uniref:Meteorin-like protein n=1 Tax=Dryococelus australis TaxID=614101 RepID=A0ABQ9I759_9NEOP|nr:hypothetical protein PR048_005066 [Dryococelus australis]